MLRCEICKKQFNVLTTHLQKAHKMPKKVYRELFKTNEFVSPELKEKMKLSQESHNAERSEFAKKQWQDGTLKSKGTAK